MEPAQHLQQLIERAAERMAERMRDEIMSAAMGEDQLLTEEEAARLLGISERTLRRMRDAGEIRAGFIGRFPRYSLGQIRRYARARMDGK